MQLRSLHGSLAARAHRRVTERGAVEQRQDEVPAAPARATRSAPLFRPAALRAAAGSPFGEALQVHWRGMWIFATSAFVLLAALLWFVATVEYAPIDRVPCYTDVRAGLVRLTAPISGQVKQIAI